MPVVTYSTVSGSQFQANSWTNGEQQSPDVIGLRNGGYVVGYLNSDLFELLNFYDAAGVTPGFTIPYANASATDAAGAPSLAQLNNGNVVVVWDDDHATTPGIVAAIFSETGAEVVSEFNITAFSGDMIPQVAALTGGGFAVTFQFGDDIYLEILDNSGVTALAEFPITGATTLDSDPAIAGLADGGVVIVWTNDTGAGTGLRCSIYNANGTVRADNILLDGLGDNNSQPSVVALPNGNFAVAYTDSGWTGTETDITVGIWDENGVFQSWTLVNAIDGSNSGDGVSESDPSITVLENGFIAVSFTDPFLVSGADDDIRFAVLDQDGNLLDVGQTILDFSTNDDTFSSISGLNSGRFISMWQDTLSDGSGGRITGRTMEIVRTTTGDNTAEVLAGDALADIMFGLGGADTLEGLAGNDTLEGGAEADVLSGGLGADTASYAGSSAGVVVRLWNGTGQNGDAQGDTLNSIENVTGSGLSDSLIGANAVGNRLEGRGGNDFLAGLSGNDVLQGGSGADQLDGGDGTDTATYADSTGAVQVSLATGTGTGSDAQGDTLANVENIIGSSSFGDTLTGNGLGNWLSGEGGNDVLIGGAGADSLNGGSGSDTANYATSAVGVTVRLWNGTGQNGDAQGDALNGIENVTGSNLGDALIGADGMANFLAGGGGNDFLAGLSGNDVLQGGAGADTLQGGAGTDTVDYATSTGGVTVRLWNQTAQNGHGQGDTLTDFENATGSNLADALVGADGIANFLAGGGGNDFLAGLSGSDVLDGGAGADQLDGGGDDDQLGGGAGADALNGGAGTDTADYAGSLVGVTVRLWNGTGQNGDAQGDTLTSIENVAGSNLADSLIGADVVANVLSGGSGNDFLAGLSGNDVLDGGSGSDQLSGGAGDDTFVIRWLFDGSNDVVTDFLAGLVPNDVIQLIGFGSAFDTFGEVIAAATQVGAHVVIDFAGFDQTLTLQNVTLANLDASDFIFG